MGGKDVISRVEEFNADREPERLALKYAAMRTSSFAFFRGTCHLFYEDLDTGALPPSPLVWCCGDLHLQNFGTYKGDNRLVYFDINDFDEACLAPASWDVVRLLSSIVVAGEDLGIPVRTQLAWMRALTGGFAAALSSGKARWIERATAGGQIRELLLELKARKRRKFLDRRAPMQRNGRRRLLIDGKRTLALLHGQREMLAAVIAKFAASEAEPGFFRILDAARRVAGTGSLGLERYVLLVEGRGSPDGNFLLDFKHEPGSCLAAVCAELPPQPKWKSEAERVAVTQHDVQAIAPALLRPVRWKGRSFLLHELAPTSDRLEIERWRDAPPGDPQIEASLRAMGQIVGWGFLRSSARRGAALPAELIEFGRNARRWEGALIECARECARRNRQQYEEFAGRPRG